MLPEEDEVSLVVEGHDPTTLVCGVRVEETRQKTGDAVTQSCVEVVQDHLWPVLRHPVGTLIGRK